MRRNSDFTSKRIDRLLAHPAVTTHYGDMVDVSSLHTLLVRIRPTEFLAAQSHVQVSFNVPDYSAEINALGSFRLLSLVSWTTVPILSSLDVGSLRGFCRHRAAKNEMTLFMPRSPYAAAKTVCILDRLQLSRSVARIARGERSGGQHAHSGKLVQSQEIDVDVNSAVAVAFAIEEAANALRA